MFLESQDHSITPVSNYTQFTKSLARAIATLSWKVVSSKEALRPGDVVVTYPVRSEENLMYPRAAKLSMLDQIVSAYVVDRVDFTDEYTEYSSITNESIGGGNIAVLPYAPIGLPEGAVTPSFREDAGINEYKFPASKYHWNSNNNSGWLQFDTTDTLFGYSKAENVPWLFALRFYDRYKVGTAGKLVSCPMVTTVGATYLFKVNSVQWVVFEDALSNGKNRTSSMISQVDGLSVSRPVTIGDIITRLCYGEDAETLPHVDGYGGLSRVMEEESDRNARRFLAALEELKRKG